MTKTDAARTHREDFADEPPPLRWVRRRLQAPPTKLEARLLGGIPKSILNNTTTWAGLLASLVGTCCSLYALPALIFAPQAIPTLFWVGMASLLIVVAAARASQVADQLSS